MKTNDSTEVEINVKIPVHKIEKDIEKYIVLLKLLTAINNGSGETFEENIDVLNNNNKETDIDKELPINEEKGSIDKNLLPSNNANIMNIIKVDNTQCKICNVDITLHNRKTKYMCIDCNRKKLRDYYLNNDGKKYKNRDPETTVIKKCKICNIILDSSNKVQWNLMCKKCYSIKQNRKAKEKLKNAQTTV